MTILESELLRLYYNGLVTLMKVPKLTWEQLPQQMLASEIVRKEQNRDEDLNAMIDFKLTGRLPQDPVIAQSVQTQKNDFMVCNGVLHRDDPKNESQGLRSLPIVVPEHLRKEVLEENHGLVTSGHFAVSKVWRRMRPLY